MERLSLLSRPKTAEGEQCLPAGDGLPLWSEVPLYAKLPVYPTPKGSVKLCTTSLCEPKHKLAHIDFDLTDPCGHLAFSEYEPLHDPHLRNHFNVPRMRRHLVRNGFMYNGKVVCNLKEFNKYRQYLRKMFLLELEYERQKQECLREATNCELGTAEESNTMKRLEIVQKRMEELTRLREQKYKKVFQLKSERHKRRSREMESERLIRELRNRNSEKKRKHTLKQHKQMIERRNKLLMRRWNTQERQRQRRLVEARQKRLSDHRRKVQEFWDARVKGQQQMLDRNLQAQKKLEDERCQGIATIERQTDARRQKLKDQLDAIKAKKKQEQEAKERRHAQRLAERLALADIRNTARKNARRRGKLQFRSMWTIMSSLRRMELQHIKEQQSQRFLNILADACDDIEVLMDDASEEWEDVPDEEEYLQLKAKEIVMNVYEQVKMDLIPKEKDETRGHISFRGRTSVIPGGSGLVLDHELKSVEDHVVTPVPSAYELEAMRLEEVRDEAIMHQDEMKLAESLLLRLLSDLNEKKLEKDEIVKLTEYCIEVVGKKDYQQAIENDVSTMKLNEFQVSGIADNLVKFTLEHLLQDIKSGGVSQEDLTKLTLSAVGSKDSTNDYQENQIDQFVEATLQDITEEREPRPPSPVNDALLDEFIVKTLKTLAADVEHGRLSKEMIEDMLGLLTAEMDDHTTEETSMTSLKSVLQKIIADLENEESESLYRVVHAFVASYLNYKESSQESLEELVRTIIERARTAVSSDTDAIESLSKLVEEMSSQSLSSAQISSIANEVIKATSMEGRSMTGVAKTIVEDAIAGAMAKVMQANASDLCQIASSLSTTINSVLHEPTSEILRRDDPFTNSVATFVTDILQVVFKNIGKGYFTDSDINEMMNSVKTVLQSSDNKNELLKEHIRGLLDDLSSGKFQDDELQNVGLELIQYGRRLLGSGSQTTRKTSSFTSTAIADDITEHLFKSMQELFQKGMISKEALKELTQCILRSSSSQSLASSGKKCEKSSSESLKMRLSSTKQPSPCDSHLAEEVVRTTVDQIQKDLEEGKLSKFSIISMASSAISLFSDDENRKDDLNTVLKGILEKLREKKLTMNEVKALFRVIIRKYQFDNEALFPNREITSAVSQLAETLIRETMMKIDRDIRSGSFTDEDMMLFAEDTRRSGRDTPSDVINLVLSVIQHMKAQVIDDMVDDNLVKFLEVVDPENSVDASDVPGILKSIDLIWCDVALNRHSSIYLNRILRNFVSHQGSNSQVMELAGILQNMNVGVLSHFVKMTVAGVLSDIRKQRIQSAGITADMSLTETGHSIQTASSMVANKLVHNLLTRIEKTVLSGQPLSSDHELVPVHSESRNRGLPFASFENELLARITSNEIGSHILESLNNIISNMRLERSVERFHHLAGDDAQKRISSGMIEDFVLETLQDIVENMQDRISNNEIQDTQNMRTDASKTSIFVMDAINNILKDMSEELKVEEHQMRQETSMSVERNTSTVSLEAEAVVVGALHNIVQDYIGEENPTHITVSKFKFDEDIRKGTLITTLQNIKRDIATPQNASVRDAMSNIIHSTVDDSDKGVDNFVEDTIDMIISNLEENKLKPNVSSRRYSHSSLETSDTLDLLVVPGDGSDTILLDGRALSLQKMAEVTSKMLKMYEDNPVTPHLSGQDLVGHISSEKMAELVSEAMSRTLSNIQTGQLSEKELHDLANALSENFPIDSLDDTTELSELQRSASFDEKSVENFVLSALEKAKHELECGLLDEGKLKMAVQSLTHLQRHESDTQASKRSSMTSLSSEMLTQLVKTVLSNIAHTFSHDELGTRNDINRTQGSTKSLVSRTSTTSIGSTKKGNINPNAATSLLSAHSSEYVDCQKKITSLPTMHSFCDVTGTASGPVKSLTQRNTIGYLEKSTVKPTCMVAPQTSSSKQSKKNKRSQLVSDTYVGRRQSVHRDSPLPVGPTISSHPPANRRNPANQQQRRINVSTNNTPTRTKTKPTASRNINTQLQERAASELSRPSKDVSSNRRSLSSMKGTEKKTTTIQNCQTPVRKPTSAKSSNTSSQPSPPMKKDKTTKVQPKTRNGSASGDKQPSKQLKQTSAKTNVSPSKKADAEEVRSLCGSHRTKITVRHNAEDEISQSKVRRPPFH